MIEFDPSPSMESNIIREFYGTGWVEVEQILDYVTEFAFSVAGLSDWYWRAHGQDDQDGGDIRKGRDGFISIMLGEALFMCNTDVIRYRGSTLSSEDECKLVRPSVDPVFPLRRTPLCCSFLMRCAQEFEDTCRPRQALKIYIAAQEFSSEDSGMKDITLRANAAIERLRAAETDSGSPTWDIVEPACVFGPFYRKDENNAWVTEFGYYCMDGRTRVEEITFSLRDFVEKKSRGDREKYLQGLCELPEVVKDFPTGTPLHCSILLHCAQEWKNLGRLDEAVLTLCRIRKIAARDPETSPTKKESCDELASIFSGELHITTDSGKVLTIDVSEFRQRLLELVDYPSLKEIGYRFFEATNYEEAIECYAHCLVKKASCHSGYASADLWQLSIVFNKLGELQATLILLEQAGLGSELEKCQCREPQIGSAVAPAQLGHDLSGRIRCPRHHLMPMILLDQGRLQSQYGSKEEARETLEKGLDLALECSDAKLIISFQEQLVQILLWQNNDFHKAGNFSLSKADHKMAMKITLQKYDADLQKLPILKDLDPERHRKTMKLLLDQVSNEGDPSENDMKLKLKDDRKVLARLQGIDKGNVRRCLMEELARAHVTVIWDLTWLNIRSCHQDVKCHFKEAVSCAKAAFVDRPEDMDTLDMRLLLGTCALHNLIQDFGEAEVLFKGAIQLVEKKLNQLAATSEKHALKFLEMTKHAYTGLIRTYRKRAVERFYKIDEDRNEQYAFDETAEDAWKGYDSQINEEYARKSLLWAERLKGRLLSKLLDTVTRTSEEKARHWILKGPFSGTSEHKFHSDDDWAMDFLFKDEQFIHRHAHFGPRLFFIVYTMVSTDEMVLTLLKDDQIIYFGQQILSDAIDKESQKLAEEEMNDLRKELRHSKNSDEDAASTSKSTIPPSLYAMNDPESRIRYYNPWIPGLVARFHRLAHKAQSKRGKSEPCKEELDQIDFLLRKLYNILVEPIAKAMRQIEIELAESIKDYMLVFVPHEDLSVVPFAALRDENGKYLIEKHPVSVCPSMWIFRHCQHLHTKQLQNAPGPELLVGRKTGYPEGWSDLQNTHEEVKKIKAFCEHSAIEVLDSGDAAERPMKERVMENVKTASWVHFAVHGEISRSFPCGSLLFGDNDMTRWNSDEIIAAGLPCAHSVVLSACQSGLGILGGEGVLGFARALVTAGVPSCVLSLWQVNDKFCSGFMEQLYKHLHDREDLAHAMRNATLYMMRQKKKLRSNRLKPEPMWLVLDWAAFYCIGYAAVLVPSDSGLDPSLDEWMLMQSYF